MNKDNNFTNQQNNDLKKVSPADKTRSFDASKIENDNETLKVDTDVNIKKAKVKKKVKKGVFGTLFVLKKACQWTLNVVLTLLLIATICGVIVGSAGYIYIQDYLQIVVIFIIQALLHLHLKLHLS